MSTTAISSTGASTATPDGSSRVPVKTLSQDDFLKLLIVQLTSQDPLKPMDDTQFMSQMTQFSALDATKAMASDVAQLRSEQQLTQANALIGRSVQLFDAQGATVTGVVSGVTLASGAPQIVVNGQGYGLSNVLFVGPAPTEQGATP